MCLLDSNPNTRGLGDNHGSRDIRHTRSQVSSASTKTCCETFQYEAWRYYRSVGRLSQVWRPHSDVVWQIRKAHSLRERWWSEKKADSNTALERISPCYFQENIIKYPTTANLCGFSGNDSRNLSSVVPLEKEAGLSYSLIMNFGGSHFDYNRGSTWRHKSGFSARQIEGVRSFTRSICCCLHQRMKVWQPWK